MCFGSLDALEENFNIIFEELGIRRKSVAILVAEMRSKFHL
jgi:hypothetical protein